MLCYHLFTFIPKTVVIVACSEGFILEVAHSGSVLKTKQETSYNKQKIYKDKQKKYKHCATP